MKNQLIDFDFQSHQVRSLVGEDGNPWFAAKDIFCALELDWSGKSLYSVPEEWKGMGKFPTPGGEQELVVINEPAVYMVAFRSNKPEAICFTKWIAGEVLPTIRKSGKYTLSSKDDTPKPKGGFSHLPKFIKDADNGNAFAIFTLKEFGIEKHRKAPEWLKSELTLKTIDEIHDLAKDNSIFAKHLIKSLYGFDVENPQLSF